MAILDNKKFTVAMAGAPASIAVIAQLASDLSDFKFGMLIGSIIWIFTVYLFVQGKVDLVDKVKSALLDKEKQNIEESKD